MKQPPQVNATPKKEAASIETETIMILHCGFAGENHSVTLTLNQDQLKQLNSGELLLCSSHNANSVGFPPSTTSDAATQ